MAAPGPKVHTQALGSSSKGPLVPLVGPLLHTQAQGGVTEGPLALLVRLLRAYSNMESSPPITSLGKQRLASTVLLFLAN